MFSHQIFQDFKENAKSTLPAKANATNSRKGLKSYNLNNFSESRDVLKSKKSFSERDSYPNKPHLKEKENSKPKVVEEPKMANHDADDSWSDIEEMHICIEPDDDYEDILPQCERIQKADIGALFLDYCDIYSEVTIDKSPSPLNSPSPLKEHKSFDFMDFSPKLPQIKATLFDDSELCDIIEN